MSNRKILSAEALELLHMQLPEWKNVAGKLCRELQFPDFKQAWAFMCRVADWAEALDHHPEWCNVYGHISIKLHTHDRDGITGLDVELAKKIDEILSA